MRGNVSNCAYDVLSELRIFGAVSINLYYGEKPPSMKNASDHNFRMFVELKSDTVTDVIASTTNAKRKFTDFIEFVCLVGPLQYASIDGSKSCYSIEKFAWVLSRSRTILICSILDSWL